MPEHSPKEEPTFEDFERMEYWCEEYQRLSDAKDHPGLIASCQERWERDPHDLHGLEALAYAHLNNGDPKNAIRVVEAHYRKDPEHPLYQAVILDAIHSQGEPIDSFDWILAPGVAHLDSELLDWLYRSLKPKRKPRELCDLWFQTYEYGHPFFSEEQLLAALQNDPRFEVEEDESVNSAQISVRRK